jgi:hypothetical protein
MSPNPLNRSAEDPQGSAAAWVTTGLAIPSRLRSEDGSISGGFNYPGIERLVKMIMAITPRPEEESIRR